MAIAAAAASGGPGWTDILTAVGTVGAVVAAVGIALWSDRRTRAQLSEERRLAREREQLAEAYRVRVVLGEPRVRSGGGPGGSAGGARELAMMVVNRGAYAITEVDARLGGLLDGERLLNPPRSARVTGFEAPSSRLAVDWEAPAERDLDRVLVPGDAGMRFDCGVVPEDMFLDPLALVRWTDWLGTRWQYRRGAVKRIKDNAEWWP